MKTLKTDLSPRVGRPRRENAGDVDVRIIAAATKLFLAKGVAETSLDAIAAEARVGKASLYARYTGKEALFEAVVKHAVESTNFAPAASDTPDKSFRVRLQRAGTSVLLQALSPVPLELMRLILTEARRHPSLTAEINFRARTEIVNSLVGSLQEKDGKVPGSQDRTRDLVERFLDLTFPVLMLGALSGESDKATSAAIDQRVSLALDIMEKTGHL